jgi:hypothetical protein
MSIKTELEWGYEPTDFFELEYEAPVARGHLRVEHGRAVVTLASPADPVPNTVLHSASDEVRAVF